MKHFSHHNFLVGLRPSMWLMPLLVADLALSMLTPWLQPCTDMADWQILDGVLIHFQASCF